MSDLTVARTILQQLGGNQFCALVGAYNLSGGDNYLSLKFRAGVKDGINYLKVTLDPNDTYTVEFGALRNLQYKKVHKFTGVYFDMLQDMFEEYTGAYVTFRPRK